jgi:hypothetical protein
MSKALRQELAAEPRRSLWNGLRNLGLASALLALLALASFTILPCQVPHSAMGASPKVPPPVPGLSPQEITKLVQQLGALDPTTRGEAFNQLLDNGPSVMQHLQLAGPVNDPGWWRLASQVTGVIQNKHGIRAVRANGLEFLPVVDLVWPIPSPGGKQPIEIGVKITSVENKPIRFCLFGTIWPCLASADGQTIPREAHGTDGFRIATHWSPPLTKGGGQAVQTFGAKLKRTENGKDLRLFIEDIIGMPYSFSGLKAGRYYLWFTCQHRALTEAELEAFRGCPLQASEPPKDGIPIWCGDTTTPLIVIEIKEQP